MAAFLTGPLQSPSRDEHPVVDRQKGNVVDVVLAPAKARKGSLPTVREIRLVQGTLKDVTRTSTASRGNGP